MSSIRLTILALAGLMLLTGCVRVYKLDIQQGNVLTQEQLDQVTPGMSQSEVRQVLGTPLVEDPFHQDRWDYFYTLKKGTEKQVERRQVVLFFNQGTLERIEGGLETEMIKTSKIDVDDIENKGLTRKERRELKKQERESRPGFMERLRTFARRLDGEE